jgi:uncharacterized protein YndB with AHSA1/START domain
MEETGKTVVTVETTLIAPIEKVWESWTGPEHITKWNSASDEWHTPRAENDLRTGGQFLSRMEAKDGSMGFDFIGVYDEVRTNEFIAYTMGDGRKVEITFAENGDETTVIEQFEVENLHPVEFQKAGWQAIMESFRKYTEAL